jgi:Mg2+/Co2+ transporter CorC
LHLPHEDFETIGGLTVGLFGRLPHEGEEIDAGEHVRLRIDRTRGRRILSVFVAHKPGGSTSDDPAAPEDVLDAERV